MARNKHNSKNDNLSKFHNPTKEFNDRDSRLDDLFNQIAEKSKTKVETDQPKQEQSTPRREIGG